jgi:carbamoyl-phosphate synthase large subunit
MLPSARRLADLGFAIAATEDTAAYLSALGYRGVRVLHKVREPDRHPNVMEALNGGDIDLMLNLPSSLTQEKFERMLEDEYVLRRRAVELGIPLFTSLETFGAYIEGIAWMREHPLTVTALYGSPEPGRTGPPSPRGVPYPPTAERTGPRP